jgi:peptidoglycan/xylan/chitin deacetylase (PgdA/CDA1 family)
VVAVASLLVVAIVVAVVVVASLGSGSPNPSPSSTASGAPPSRAPRPSTSRSPTPSRAAAVPILAYHVINAQPAGSTASPSLYVPAAEFSSQMRALKADGWHAVTLDQVKAHWDRGAPLGPGKPIVITFDGGYASQSTNALPVLKALGWSAVENLPVSGLRPSDGGVSDAQVRGLIAAGWELDTEGLSDVALTTLDPTQMAEQVLSARPTLHSRYGVPVNWFSYPSGDYNPTVTAAVRAAGYYGATTVNPGWATPRQDRYRLPRLFVRSGLTSTQLLARIAAAKANTSVPSSHSGPGVA